MLLWFLSRQSVSDLLDDKILAAQAPAHSLPPGFSSSIRNGAVTSAKDSLSPIFITSRFRSGSTLLWRFFRASPSTTAYYEPLNPRCWFNNVTRGEAVDTTHRGVSNYWQEYQAVSNCKDIPWADEWASRELYLPPTMPKLELQKYLSLLIESAQDRPVLQFNRCDFRLHWLTTYFPSCQIVHLHRNPRDQWLSTFLKGSPVGKSASMSDFLPHDEFYLTQWIRDLRKSFPVLREVGQWHPYGVSYLLSRLSNIYGRNFSNVTISYEDLISQPAQTLHAVEAATGCVGLAQSEIISALDGKSVQRWKNYASDDWFAQLECSVDGILERILDCANDQFYATPLPARNGGVEKA